MHLPRGARPSGIRRRRSGGRGAPFRFRAGLPHGGSLPPASWQRRHRALRALLWAHGAAVPLLALASGRLDVVHSAVESVPMLAFALLASVGSHRRAQSAAVALGLLTASATVVHVTGGAVEAHFHVFVVVSLLTLYEDWLPFGIALAFVIAHHAVAALLLPGAVYEDPANILLLAVVHSAFIFAAAAANVVAWRAGEEIRRDAAAAHTTVQTQYDVSRVLSVAGSLQEAAPQLLEVIGCRLGWSNGMWWLPDADGLSMRPSALWHRDPEQEEAMRGIAAHPVMPGEGMSGRAWRSGAPEWTRDLVATATGSRRAAVEALGQRAAVAVPVKAGDEVLAVLTFTSDADLHSDAAMTQLLSSLSGLLAMFIDRLRRSEQLAVMEDAALTDSLTGLANRRHWDVRLARELLSADLGAGRLCVALIDLDAFKALNDRDGHAAGDRLLRACAAAWTQRLRDSDLLVRFGGDEFALVCPGVTLAAAFEIAERMRAATPGRQRCSIGVAAWDGAESAEALVQRADTALYAAKRRGRDCTVAA